MSMIEDITDTDVRTLERFDTIIDVRSPAEFAEDHLPGAINLPVLSNDERAKVGTIYKQESQFRARRIGAAYVARNVANHLDGALADKTKNFHPLLYCWRGGMRSGAMATILTRVGWRSGVLYGGYKTWRREVVTALRNDGPPLKIVLLDGQTGTAKSDILRRLPAHGVQIIDLEALANHRGSVFGGFGANTQPPQKLFESRLWDALRRLDPARPILVEAESNRIARCEIPKRLWTAMADAPHITASAPVEARATYLVGAYADICADAETLTAAINRLSPFHAKTTIADWLTRVHSKELRPLAEALMREHYDPLYDRSRRQHNRRPLAPSFQLDELNGATFDTVAKEIASALCRYENKDTP